MSAFASSPEDVSERHGSSQSKGASAWLIAGCMVVIAGSLAAFVYLQFSLSITEAAWIGFGALIIMVLTEFLIARGRERGVIEAELLRINRTAADLQGELVAIDERIAEIEATFVQRLDEAVETRMGLVSAELQMLEARIEEVAGSHAARRQERTPDGAASAAPDRYPARDERSNDGALPGMSVAEAHEMIRRAVEAERIDVFLQPVVTLPQRKVRYYEATARLRSEDGRTISPKDYLLLAETAGVMPLIDSTLLLRCVQILRRMNGRSREICTLCSMSARTLADSHIFPRIFDLLVANRELAGSLVLLFPQAGLEQLGAIEQANLDALAELGLRFAIDDIGGLDIDGARHAERNVRFAKVDAGLLLNPPQSGGADIHAADLARLLARSGIELIAGNVATEAQLVDLLDYDLRLAQGELFSPPRPVRSEFLADGPAPGGWAHAS